MGAFAEAEFFLYLRSQLQPAAAPEYPLWAPWSMLAMRQPPSYLRRAVHASYAVKLLGPLGVKDTNSLRARLKERTDRIVPWWGQGMSVDLGGRRIIRSEEHTSELQSHLNLVCRLLLEKTKQLIGYILSD